MTQQRRPGGGRKPDDGNVVRFPAVQGVEADALKVPPPDLPEGQQPYWRRLAPIAIAQGTLVDSTTPGFRELCELLLFKDEVSLRLQRFGSDGKSGAERLRNYGRLARQADATLARFKLTAFGKPAVSTNKPAAGNPFAALFTKDSR